MSIDTRTDIAFREAGIHPRAEWPHLTPRELLDDAEQLHAWARQRPNLSADIVEALKRLRQEIDATTSLYALAVDAEGRTA